MADQNQSPASQTSVSLSGIAYSLTASGSPTWQASLPLSLTVVGASTTISSGSVSFTVPTTGQIWPLGVFR